ncbi:MAG: PspA/IM30 family protein [Granulosicoccus sp.]
MTGIVSRFGSAISSHLHDMLDRAESPDAVISQLVRESTDNITRARTLAIDAVASEKRLANDIGKLEASVVSWTAAVREAMESQDEEAARIALGKKIEASNTLEMLKPQYEIASSNSQKLKIRLKNLEESLATLKSKKVAIQARQKGAEALAETDNAAIKMITSSDIDAEVSRVEDIVLDLEARNEAVSEIQSFSHPEIDIDAHHKSDQLERELAELRKNA